MVLTEPSLQQRTSSDALAWCLFVFSELVTLGAGDYPTRNFATSISSSFLYWNPRQAQVPRTACQSEALRATFGICRGDGDNIAHSLNAEGVTGCASDLRFLQPG